MVLVTVPQETWCLAAKFFSRQL